MTFSVLKKLTQTYPKREKEDSKIKYKLNHGKHTHQ